ncbi:Argininosuccinate lyase 1 [uncultured Alphaproteobacteria bacterium]|uniref:Argininosuccinate lyase n=1 Tax=uncultured Alphaproteobacteria bacterium TaxID=91750 RepID=A0A212JG77_9PROT|nr:Argininosuccinate lyase 1 [uncultured Alphaproteobacteria bacterium]
MRERVKLPPSKVLIDYVMRPRLEADSQDSFAALMDLNRAHVVMLAAQGIVTKDNAGKLMRIFEEVLAAGPEAITWDPALEEVYYNLETHIIKKAGSAIGGQMHTGRSRNDLSAALTRMSARAQLHRLAGFLHALRQQLLDLAEAHADTIVTGYTHMQPAQPTTLGHYFHALAQAMSRDETRLQQCYEVANASPLGACAFNSTGFPIDRRMVADLTGFSGLVENSIDAVASRDYVPQILACLATMGVNLSRLAQDLYIWSTDEFGWVEVGDDLSATSSIMPQKKNPISLEHIRGKSSHLIGALVAALAAQKGTPYGHLRDISLEATQPLRDGFREAEAVVNLATETLRSLRINAAAATARTAENFSTVTELADVIVRETGLSFRDAHVIVGTSVGRLHETGGRTDDLGLDLIETVAKEHLGRPLGLREASLRKALTPAENVAVRRVTGGPAPVEVRRSVNVSRKRLADDEGWWREQQGRLDAAHNRLDAAAAELI